MSLLLALTGSAPQTITASGLSNPSAMGVATASLNISASGIAQPVSFGSATLTIAGTEEPSIGFWFDVLPWFRPQKPRQRVVGIGIAQHVGFGVATLTLGRSEPPEPRRWQFQRRGPTASPRREREDEELLALLAMMG